LRSHGEKKEKKEKKRRAKGERPHGNDVEKKKYGGSMLFASRCNARGKRGAGRDQRHVSSPRKKREKHPSTTQKRKKVRMLEQGEKKKGPPASGSLEVTGEKHQVARKREKKKKW